MIGLLKVLAGKIYGLFADNHLWTLYLLFLALLLSPLWPLDIVLVLYLLIYMYKRHGFRSNSLLIIGAGIVYIVSSSMNYHIVGLIVLTGYMITSLIAVRKPLLLLGVALSVLLTYQVLELSHTVTDYLFVLGMFFVRNGYEFVGIHIIVLLTVIVYVSMSSSFFKDTRIGRYITENPGAYPIIQFIVLLLYAAVQLTYGREVLANKYAELAYYSLVVGVALSIPGALAEKPGKEEASM